MKIVKWAILIIVLLVVVAGIVLYTNLNGIVRSTVQSQSQKSLNLPTQLASANLSLFGGSLSLNGYQVSNPTGFSQSDMLSLDRISVKVNYGQLRKEPIHIENIEIDGPKLLLERAGTKLNLQAAMDQMPQSEPSQPSADTSSSEPLKIIIDKLTIADAQVVIKPNLPGLPEQYTLSIPSVVMENIGTGEDAQNGAAIKEIVMKVSTTLASKATESEQLPPEVRQLLSGDLSNLKQAVQEQFDKQAKKLTDKLEEKLPQGVSNILGNNKKDDSAEQGDKKDAVQGLKDLLPRKDK